MENNKKKINNVIRLIAKIFLLSTAGIFLLSALMATFTKMPIEGSIYKTNTTREERELMWEAEFERLYKIYDESTDVEYYENKMQVSSFLNLLYKYTYVDTNPTDAVKELRLEIINYSENSVMSMSSIEIENWDDETDIYTTTANERILFSKGVETYIFIVPLDFNIRDYTVSANNVRYDNYTYNSWFITTYERELEVTKSNKITLRIYDEIGERPTVEYETQEPIPDYMADINDNFEVCVILYVLSVVFAGFAFMLKKRQSTTSNTGLNYAGFNNVSNQLDDQDNNTNDFKQELKEEIIEEIQRKSVKKVICLHCESRYNDDLDECPNCGSAKIYSKEE